MERKQIIAWIVLFVIFGLFCAFYVYANNQPKEIDCDEPFDVVFLKASEMASAGELGNIHDIVLVPEENLLLVRSEIGNCKNYDPYYYLQMMRDINELIEQK